MDEFLGRYDLWKSNHHEVTNLNRTIIANKTEAKVKSHN